MLIVVSTLAPVFARRFRPGSVGIAAYRSRIGGLLPDGLSPDATADASDSVNGAMATATELPGTRGEQLVSAVQKAFTGGMNTAAIVSAVVAGLVAIIAATRCATSARPGRRRKRSKRPPVEPYPPGV